MFGKLVLFITLASSAVSRHVPRYANLDEDDQLLFRAAYDTPTYEHTEYQEELPLGKLDLLKDGMWVMKASINEMKIFNKALAANLLSTKLQLKELLQKQLNALKHHHHVEIVKKPIYSYQSPRPSPVYPHYEAPQYSAPVKPQYESPHYSAPVPQYEAPHYAPVPQYEAPHYSAPVPQYEAPHYSAPVPQYEAPHYSAPVHQYGPPQQAHQYGESQNSQQYEHDPYYGH